MGNRLDGKVCVVTGAGSGMGRASAIEMATQGAKVAVTDVNTRGGQETLDQIRAEGGTAIFIGCDLRDPRQIDTLMLDTASAFGGIDVLHNNAAIHDTQVTDKNSIQDTSEDVWNLIFDVNLKAMWRAMKSALPYLKKSTAASIVNVGSVGSMDAYPMSSCYCISKAAVTMLTKTMAMDLAKYGIRCNCYCPGAVDTPMTQKYYENAPDKEAMIRLLTGANLIPRLANPAEIAKLACFLASDDSSYITGAVYMIDGGVTAWSRQQMQG